MGNHRDGPARIAGAPGTCHRPARTGRSRPPILVTSMPPKRHEGVVPGRRCRFTGLRAMGAGIAAGLAEDQVIAGPVVLLAFECPGALCWPWRQLPAGMPLLPGVDQPVPPGTTPTSTIKEA